MIRALDSRWLETSVVFRKCWPGANASAEQQKLMWMMCSCETCVFNGVVDSNNVPKWLFVVIMHTCSLSDLQVSSPTAV